MDRCDAALGAPSFGVGAVAGATACGALAGAVGNAVSYGITAAQHHDFSWSGLAKSAATGAVTGALGGFLGGAASEVFSSLGGVVSGLLKLGEDASDSLLAESGAADGAADDALASSADSGDGAARPSGSDGGDGGSAGGGGKDTESPGTTAEDDAPASCRTGGQSFTATTRVLTASGHLVAISKLRKGDKVLATNTKSGKTSPEPVAAVLVRHDSDLYDLRVATAHGTAVIDTTRSHLFFDAGHHRWVKAAALKYGTRLRTPSGATATTRGGHNPKITTGWMWDLNIPGGNDHDFYIHAATTAILVHNCGETGQVDYGSTEDYSRSRSVTY
jgi:large repetitive protein